MRVPRRTAGPIEVLLYRRKGRAARGQAKRLFCGVDSALYPSGLTLASAVTNSSEFVAGAVLQRLGLK
jgi:hypothetical protein